MSSSAIRTAIKAVLATVTDVGTIHERERAARTLGDVKELYGLPDGTLRGGFIRRADYRKQSASAGHDYVITTDWEIHYLTSFVDANESEIEFDDLVDAIDAAFRADTLLGDAVEATITPEQAGLALVSSKPAMFHGVLVHYAVLTLQTEHSEDP